MKKVTAKRTIYIDGTFRKRGSTFELPEYKVEQLTDKQVHVHKGFEDRKTKERPPKLSDKTVAELNEIAKGVSLKGYSTMNKAELIEALKNKL